MTSASASPEPSHFSGRRVAGLLLPYLALVLIHLLSGLEVEQPLILADEVGYLGNARYLAGSAHLPDMQGSQFYHFGYSLFLLPAFWLFSDPMATYKAAIAINALLISALFFPLHYLLTSFLGVARRAARWIAFACCLYPSLLLYSSFAWSENAFIPCYAAAAALFGRYLASRSARDALLFSLTAGFLYTIHPRALPVVAAALVYLLLLALLRSIPLRQLLLSVSTTGVVVLVTRTVNQHLNALAWDGGGEVSAAKMASRLIPGPDFPALVERSLGQLLYLSLATHGLFLLGIAVTLWFIMRSAAHGSVRRALESPVTGVPIFILVTAAGIFAAAVALKLYSLHGLAGVRGADFIHGRYNESLAIFASAFALAELFRKGLANRQLAWLVIATGVVTLVLGGVVMVEVEDALERQVAGRPGLEARQEVLPSGVDAVAVPGIYPIVGLVGSLNLRIISLISFGALLLVTVATRLSGRAGIVLLVAAFLSFAYYNHRNYLLPRLDRVKPRLALAAEVRRLGPIATVSYDAAYREPGLVPSIQYLLPQTVFERFDSRAGQEPRSKVVLGSSGWPQADRLGARFVISSGRGGALWVLPGELQSRLPEAGYEGLTLGVEARLGLRETGFYPQESFAGVAGRWTNGAATLNVPVDPRQLPRSLEIETLAPGREGTRLQVLANDVELWNREIPRLAWSRSFSLDDVPMDGELVIELNSDTFSPAELRPSSRDRRRLGIVVLGIRLTGAESGVF